MTMKPKNFFPEKEYREFLEQGRFMLQRCVESGEYFFYPRIAEPGSGSQNLEWIEPSSQGVVYSSAVIRVKPPGEAYNIALIDLAEGPRMLSRVIGIAPTEVTIGMAVRAKVIRDGETALVVFEPDTTGQKSPERAQ